MFRNQPMARRALRAVVILTALAVTAFAVGGASAVPSPPFNECPLIGVSPSCGMLIEFTDSGTKLLFDTSVKPYDGEEDTLVGVVNDSSQTVNRVTLSGIGVTGRSIFGFEPCGASAPRCPRRSRIPAIRR